MRFIISHVYLKGSISKTDMEGKSFLGYFSTESEARKAMNFYTTLPEYKNVREGIRDENGDYTNEPAGFSGFYITLMSLGDGMWNTGFFTAGEDDELEETDYDPNPLSSKSSIQL